MNPRDDLTTLILQSLQSHQGLLIGECHASFAPIDFLVKYVEIFKKVGVKYIFTEKFIDKDTEYLGNFFQMPHSFSIESFGILDHALSAFNSQTQKKAKEVLVEFAHTMRNNQIRIIGINSVEINRRHNVGSPRGRSNSALEMNVFMGGLIKKVIKNDEKFLVLGGAAHVSRYIDYQEQDIYGISEYLSMQGISCFSFHIYESCFFQQEISPLGFNNVSYKIGDMQDKEALNANKLLQFNGRNAVLIQNPPKIQNIIPQTSQNSVPQRDDNSVVYPSPISTTYGRQISPKNPRTVQNSTWQNDSNSIDRHINKNDSDPIENFMKQERSEHCCIM